MFSELLLLKSQILISTFFSDAVKSLIGLEPGDAPPSPSEMGNIADARRRASAAAAAASGTTVVATPPPGVTTPPAGVSWQQMEEEERRRQEDEALRLEETSLFPPTRLNLPSSTYSGQDDRASLLDRRASLTSAHIEMSNRTGAGNRSNAGSNRGSPKKSPKKKV